MTSARVLISLALSAACLAACGTNEPSANLEDRVKQATVAAIAASDPAAVTVSDIDRSGGKTAWKAVAGGKSYVCDADDQVRLPDCRAAT
jgi:hypothetical protein